MGAPWTSPYRRPAVRRAAAGTAVAAVALLGAWSALLLGGATSAGVGPVEADLALRPAVGGATVVEVPPLGSLTVDSHDAPVRLQVTVDRLDVEDARALLRRPASLDDVQGTVVRDMRTAVLRATAAAALLAVAGAWLAGLLVFRRARRALACAALAAAGVAGTAGAAALTFDPRSLSEPRYEGLLASAPRLVGDAGDIVGNFGRYREQLTALVTNVSVLYDAGLRLPTYEPDEGTVRLLHVSDIHLNPAAWNVIRSTATQFGVDAVVDTGDLTDHGTTLEARFADAIPTVGLPYVFVRGNHDSMLVQERVAAQDGAVVLDEGSVAEVAGLRLAGWGDPRFTPDQRTRATDTPERVRAMGTRFADALAGRPADAPVHLALVHDPEAAQALDGRVPLVLAGHGHRRETYSLPGGTRVFEQGSTGGAGLRGLENEEPTPVQATVLYLDRSTGALTAWDDITLGGLGLTSAQIERHVPDELVAAPAAPPRP